MACCFLSATCTAVGKHLIHCRLHAHCMSQRFGQSVRWYLVLLHSNAHCCARCRCIRMMQPKASLCGPMKIIPQGRFVTREAPLHNTADMRKHDQHLLHTFITYKHTKALVAKELCLYGHQIWRTSCFASQALWVAALWSFAANIELCALDSRGSTSDGTYSWTNA